MDLYKLSVVSMSARLRDLDRCLDKAIAFAEAKPMAVDDLVGFRLAADMKPLSFQIQAACDAAKFSGCRLAGVEAPSHPDTETTMAELKARIASVLSILGDLTPEQFADAGERQIQLSFTPGHYILGQDYLADMGVPNFHFHVTMAYALLRMSGVAVGKRDYISGLTLHAITE